MGCVMTLNEQLYNLGILGPIHWKLASRLLKHSDCQPLLRAQGGKEQKRPGQQLSRPWCSWNKTKLLEIWDILISYFLLQIKGERIKGIKLDIEYKWLVVDLTYGIMIWFFKSWCECPYYWPLAWDWMYFTWYGKIVFALTSEI